MKKTRLMLTAFTMTIRCLLSVVGALGLLYFLSYPDSILPPNPNIAYVQGFTLYEIKPIIWVLPMLFMELVSICGRRRNFVWFFGMLSVLLSGVIAYPVLKAWAPEWVTPTFEYEDGKLTMGLFYFSIILFVSYIFRCGLFVYLFREKKQQADESGTVEADVLDPSAALTVQEIIALPQREAPRFLFAAPDGSAVARFLELMHRLGISRLRRWAFFFSLALLLVAWFFFYPQPSEEQAFNRDRARMYEHVQKPNGRLMATRGAVHAACRVLRKVADGDLFTGKSVQEAEEWLQLDRAPANYRAILRDDADLPLASTDAIFESRTRFFTVQDGKRFVVLFVRMKADGVHINVAEMVDAGWNAVMDDKRRRFGSDISSRFFSR